VTRRDDQSVEINGYTVPPGSCVIHFYYSPYDQQRLLSFLLDGISRREGVVLACTQDAYATLREGLEMLGVRSTEPGIVKVAITPDLQTSIANIQNAAGYALGRDHSSSGRVLSDFGCMVSQESIFELEGSLNSALRGMNLVSVTQYDGRGFAAPVTIEQFQTHALAIVGNAFFRENSNYTPPEAYFLKRAAASHR
jgi:hypothetical protein